MGFRVGFIAAAILWRTVTASGQSSPAAPESAPIVQPGAPGQSSKRITAAEAAPPLKAPSAADVSFMQGMILHHSQAVQMTDLLRVRTHNKELLKLGKRISISQTDEMKYMKQWLEDRGAPVSMDRSPMHSVSDKKVTDSMAHMHMGSMPMNSMMMPGMLTPQQMMALEQARGATFDHLFLTGMIHRCDSYEHRQLQVRSLSCLPAAIRSPHCAGFGAWQILAGLEFALLCNRVSCCVLGDFECECEGWETVFERFRQQSSAFRDGL